MSLLMEKYSPLYSTLFFLVSNLVKLCNVRLDDILHLILLRFHLIRIGVLLQLCNLLIDHLNDDRVNQEFRGQDYLLHLRTCSKEFSPL